MAEKKLTQQLIHELVSINLKNLSVEDLNKLFLELSNKFIARLEDCEEIEELKEVQTYMRSITEEIFKRQN